MSITYGPYRLCLTPQEIEECRKNAEEREELHPTPIREIEFKHKDKTYKARVRWKTAIGYEVIEYVGNECNLSYIPYNKVV